MSSAKAAEYHLSPQGDDANPGTPSAPWRTIEKANKDLRPGDTALFLPGEYSGTICPANSGSEDAPITYRSRDRYNAVLVGSAGIPPVKMSDRDHIAIDGFRFDPGTEGWVDVERCNGLEIRNCDMVNGGTHYLVLHAVDCESIRLIDCQFRKNHFRGDMVHLDRCDRAVIEGCSFSHVGHGPFVLRSCNYAVVRSNLFHNPWGRNQVIWTSGRVLFESNVVTEALDSAYSATSAAKHLTIDGIFRFNRIYGNRYLPMVSGSYVPPKRWAEDVNEPFRMEDTRIYHNVLADNLFRAWRLWGITTSGNEFVNNIFSGNDPFGAGIQLTIDPHSTDDNRFSHNIICADTPGRTAVRFGRKLWTTRQANEQGPAYQYWRVFENNIDAVPAFVDPGNADHRLSPSSAGIDGGRPLTQTSMAGSGRQLPVVDGRWFYDGNGIPGERGDLIAVGSADNVARVEKVELNYYRPAILHLDRDLSWDADSPVSLPWTGDAPDIGVWQGGSSDAMPVYAVARPSTVPPGDTVEFEALIHNPEGVREATWEFGDGASAMGFAASHTYERIGPYPVRLRLVHADGYTVRAMLLVKV
ncbi:MAG: right-handed parallel beta-helix repeat-containing protein, partial [Candidatus Latescibacteria bacterium]|nr:right-handed parallel beta-helix repeat-containing protein [Candidatus Latescibacterota bacterium]